MDENSNKYAISSFAFMCSLKVSTINRCNLANSSSLLWGLGGLHCKGLAVRKVRNGPACPLARRSCKGAAVRFLFRFYIKSYTENTIRCQEFPNIKEMGRILNPPPPDLPLLHHLKLNLLQQRLVKFKSGKMAAAAAAANVGAAAGLNSSARGSEISPELPSAERNNQ